LTEDEIAKLLRDDNWKSEPRYLCESDYLDGSSKDNAHDFIFQDITENPVEALPSNAVLVGIEVTVRARTKLRTGATDDGDLMQRCYFSSVELRNGKDVNSDNRGSDQVSPRIPVGTDWTDVTFGDHRDLWDEFEDLSAFKLTPKIEVDMLAHWFDKKSLKSVSHPEDKPTLTRAARSPAPRFASTTSFSRKTSVSEAGDRRSRGEQRHVVVLQSARLGKRMARATWCRPTTG
jgi:hypothetical protein